MTYEDLKDDPAIQWCAEPIIGSVLLIQSSDMIDSYMRPILPSLKYWVGKHTEQGGMLVVFLAEKESTELFNDVLREADRLN